MRNIVTSFLLASITFLNSFSFAQTTVVLSPSEDANVGFHDGFNSANTNYGSADFFAAFWQPAAMSGENGGRSLMNFDFSLIPSGMTIISASLNLYGRGPYGVGDAVSHGNFGQNESYLQRITSTWSESSVTWNTQPTSTSIDQVLLPSSTDSIQDYLSIDVTDLIQDIMDDPQNSFGLMIKLVTEEDTRSLAFCSRDFPDPDKHPVLTVTYSCQGTSQLIKYPSYDAGIGFHDGFNSANTNYGTADYYAAFSQPGSLYGENAGEGLMAFDFTDIPAGSIVVSAFLDLFGRGPYGVGDAVSIGNAGSNASYLQRITTPWNESTVTWNTQPVTTTTDEVALAASNYAIQDYLGIDATHLVQDMLDNPSTSYGFRLVLQVEDPTRSLAFCSSNYADSAKYPKLTIVYSCPESMVDDPRAKDIDCNVFPSPSSTSISLRVSQNILSQTPIFNMYDVSGRRVLSKPIGALQSTFNIKSFPKGIYLYLVSSEKKQIAAGKIILE